MRTEVKPSTILQPIHFEGVNFKYVACGGSFTLAIDIYGNLYSWGAGSSFALGNLEAKDVYQP